MAKINKGIFGPLTGKIGNFIGSTWLGIPYLKKAPVKDKNSKRSAAQIANSQKFGYVSRWLVPFHPFITVGFSTLAIRKTAISAALSSIYNTVFTGEVPDLKVDYSKMEISKGRLRGLSNASITCLENNTMNIKWDENSGPTARFNDQLIVMFYSEKFEMTDGLIGNVSRADKKHVFSLNETLIGQPLHAYMAVISYDRKKASNTTYIGLIQPFRSDLNI
jgi:hypothetical protein